MPTIGADKQRQCFHAYPLRFRAGFHFIIGPDPDLCNSILYTIGGWKDTINSDPDNPELHAITLATDIACGSL